MAGNKDKREKRKEAPNNANMQQGSAPKQAMDQQMQLAKNMQQLAEIKRLKDQTKLLAHEGMNKAHDTEFSQFSEGTGGATLGIIGEKEVNEAYATMQKYSEEKSKLKKRLEDNERFWKLRHWEDMADSTDKRIQPKSAWLFNTIINKHADAMDNYPEANILPRARDDEKTAEVLAEVIPVILEQNNFQKTYSDIQWYKAKNGTGVYGIFWDNDKNNGLGDISIKKISLANLYWKGGIEDIQDSPHIFMVEAMDNDEIKARYPMIKPGNAGVLALSAVDEINHDEHIDQSKTSAVIDWYYRRRIQGIDEQGIPQTKTVLHYCKFCNGQVIYASENDPRYADSGWYAHGEYPFVFDVLYPVESEPCGLGYIDIVKDDQLFIDKMQQAILENAVSSARPRYAVRTDANLNEEEFLDLSNPLVHFDGNLGEDAFRQIVASPLSGIYETVLQTKISEMKDTTGNTASSQGQTSSVTSASGIASLQEAAGKLSRDTNQESYRAFKLVVNQVIELIRQFYTEPRCFRIAGDFGKNEYVEVDNTGLLPKSQGSSFGFDMGTRLPIMDIDVKAQKKNAYSKESQNQTALSLYNMGFFAPDNADASLACLEMMDLDGMEKLKDTIRQNGTLYEKLMQMQMQMQQMATIIDAQNGTNIAQGVANAGNQLAQTGDGAKQGGAKTSSSKGSLSSQAAAATRNSAAPR